MESEFLVYFDSHLISFLFSNYIQQNTIAETSANPELENASDFSVYFDFFDYLAKKS